MIKARGYNFGAGPAMLPESILKDAQDDLLNWQNTGMSILEVGHRTPKFMHLMEQAQDVLRDLLKIPANVHLLFLGGAARTQFAMIPLNFLNHNEQAGYLITGIWSALAYEEALKLKKAYCVASSQDDNFANVPRKEQWKIKEKTRYLYYTTNETVNGVRFSMPESITIPLVADMTSSLLSEPIRVEDYDLIFAGAQKNIANAGLTVVMISDRFLESIENTAMPTMLDYRKQISEKSLYATPPTFNCYMALKMFSWLKEQGGVDALYAQNCKKAAALYQFIDSSSFYYSNVAKPARSLVNVCFYLRRAELSELFLTQAEHRGLYGLKGHRAVGGIRASVYNAMPLEGVYRLMEFMHDFAKDYKE